jgi:DNA-binding PadR family transcriptional regulator
MHPNSEHDHEHSIHQRGGPFAGHRHHHPRGGRPFPPEGPGFRRHRGGRGRAPRGDVRAATLLLLAEQPMHGYQLMQAIAERSGGRWAPSPGAIYPTISQLEDEGLVTVTADSGRKLVTLTDAGREHVASLGNPFESFPADDPATDLRALVEQLHGAIRQVALSGTEAQRTAAAGIIADARRALYLLLADGPGTTDA